MAPLPATFTYSAARSAGLARHHVYALRDAGRIESIGHGVYRKTNEEPADLDLLTVAICVPRATLCLLSALAEHDLTDEIPVELDIALPRGMWQPRLGTAVHWYSFAVATFDVGRTERLLDGRTSIGLYHAARTIVDCYRFRARVGPEVPHEALRRWLRGGGQPGQLMTAASNFPRALPAVRQALELLL